LRVAGITRGGVSNVPSHKCFRYFAAARALRCSTSYHKYRHGIGRYKYVREQEKGRKEAHG